MFLYLDLQYTMDGITSIMALRKIILTKNISSRSKLELFYIEQIQYVPGGNKQDRRKINRPLWKFKTVANYS